MRRSLAGVDGEMVDVRVTDGKENPFDERDVFWSEEEIDDSCSLEEIDER